jgi:RNA polymerase sigma factor (sigma-70 family)
MTGMTDVELLREYAETRSHRAFAELVSRHGDWIYSTAFRLVRRRDWAEDVTQAVFLVLAQRADKLKASALNAWLFKVTRYCALNILREENRRKERERQAAIMNSQTRESAAESTWEEIAPILEQTVGRLRAADRDAVLLRFYQQKSMLEVGDALGVSEDAARKRVAKAVGRLRSLMSANGVLLPEGVVLPLISERITQAAPAGLQASCLPGVATGPAIRVAQGVNQMLLAMKVRLVSLAIVALAVISTGVWIGLRASAAEPAGGGNAPVAAVAAAHEAEITVDSDFESGTSVEGVEASPGHVMITLDTQHVNLDWWMFRLNNVAGKKVTIDVELAASSRSGLEKWATLNPVYGSTAALDDPSAFATGPVNAGTVSSRHGIGIPATDEQTWHYIQDASLVNNHHFRMTQTFSTDSVYVAGRVPYTAGYSAQFLNGLGKNPLAKVIELGQTTEGRSIRVVQIGGTDEGSQKTKPSVIICGGEQAYQPDGMWACQGAIEFLLGNSIKAKALRDECVFFIIPMLDPDGTANSNSNFVGSFRPGSHNTEGIAYADWLQSRVVAGGRIDLVLDLHSLQSSECQHLQRVELRQSRADRPAFIEVFQKIITKQFMTDRLSVTQETQNGGATSPFRFPGWVSRRYGALDISYEVNSQASVRHLTLSQLKDTGRLFVQASGEFFASTHGAQLMASVDQARAERAAVWNGNPATNPSQNAIESEDAAAPIRSADRRRTIVHQ